MPRCVNYIRHQCLAISRYRNTKVKVTFYGAIGVVINIRIYQNGDTTLHHVIRKHMAKSFVEWVFVSCPDHVNAINLVSSFRHYGYLFNDLIADISLQLGWKYSITFGMFTK